MSIQAHRQTPDRRLLRSLHAVLLTLLLTSLALPSPSRSSTVSIAANANSDQNSLISGQPPAVAAPPAAEDSCVAVLPAGAASDCLFGAVFFDGEAVEHARVTISRGAAQLNLWTTSTAGEQPRFALDLGAPPLNAGPDEQISVVATYASHNVASVYTVLPGQQRLDLVLPLSDPALPVNEQPLLAPDRTIGVQEARASTFRFPHAVAVDPSSDTVYVADSGNGRIQAFDSAGRFLRAWGTRGTGYGQLSKPIGISVDARGRVYVVDQEASRVTKFSAGGDVLGVWGGVAGAESVIGSTTVAFRNPRAIATVGEELVYVADTGNGRIVVLRNNGEVVAIQPIQGANGQGLPTGIAVEADGTIYVAEGTRNLVLKFASLDAPPLSWAAQGSLDVNGGAPLLGLSVDSGADTLYVADVYSNRVLRFRRDGTFVDSIAGSGGVGAAFATPFGVAAASGGTFYVADTYSHRMQKLSATGASLTLWGERSGADGLLNLPYDVAIGPNGHVYVADTDGHSVQVFTASGVFLTRIGTEGTGDGQFRSPFGIDVAEDGTVFVADYYNDRIVRLNADGIWVDVFPTSLALSRPRDVAVTSDKVYVTSDSTNEILVFQRGDGTFLQGWGGTGSGNSQFKGIFHLDVGADGRVYVADVENNRIQVFDGSGTPLRALGPGDPNNAARLLLPYGVAVGGGRIYVADSSNSRLAIYRESDYSYIGSVGQYGSADALGSGVGQFNGNTGIALDNAGRVYVADHNANRIAVYRPASSLDPIATIVQATPRTLVPGQGLSLRGAGASPLGAAITGYQWALDGQPLASGPNPQISAAQLAGLSHGRHSLSLRVSDADGRTSEPQSIPLVLDVCIGAAEGTGAPGCLTGSVYSDGKPIAGAQVLVRYGAGKVFETWTEARPGEPFPTYSVDFAALGISANQRITLEARYSRHLRELQHNALAGRQQVDLVLPRNGVDDYILDATLWQQAAPGSFFFPYGIAIDSRGNSYVTDTRNGRVQVFGPKGQLLRQWGTLTEGGDELYFPQGIAIDENDAIYVVANRSYSSRTRVLKFNTHGELLGDWGGPASGLAFDSVGDIAVADGKLYVLENNRVRVFAIGGGEMSFNSAVQLNRPRGIAIDSRGNIYIADQANHRVQKLDSSGTVLQIWGEHGAGPGQFKEPEGIALDAAGNVFVIDHGNHRVQRLDAASAANNSGNFAPFVGTPNNTSRLNDYLLAPTDLATGPNGTVYVIDPFHSRFQVFDADGNWLWGRSGPEDFSVAGFPLADGRLHSPRGITLDRYGDLLIADTGNARIQRWAPDGRWLASYGTAGVATGQFGFAQCVERDLDGNVYICDGVRNRIQKLAPDGSFSIWLTELNDPRDIAIAGDTVYVADTGNKVVNRYTRAGVPQGAAITGFGNPLVPFSNPLDIALDAEGNLYVADLPDAGNGCVSKFNSTGASLAQVCSYIVNEQTEPLRPAKVDTGLDGMVYISDGSSSEIIKLDPSLPEAPLAVFQSGNLYQPRGVAVAADGTVYAVDFQANRILSFEPMRDERPVATIVQGRQRALAPGERLRLRGMGGSSMPGGRIVGYEWLLDGRNVGEGDTLNLSAANLALGLHTLTFRVYDSRGVYSTPQRFTFVVGTAALYVAPTGNDANNCRVVASPCATIGAALTGAVAGDTIILAPGRYAERLTLVRNITLAGAGSQLSVIDAERGGRAITVGAGVEATLLGLTIQGGQVVDDGGGLRNEGTLTIADTLIVNNIARGNGAGIASHSAGALTLLNSTVLSNSAVERGGGIYASGPLSTVTSLVSGNTSRQEGGGIFSIGRLALSTSTVSANQVLNTAGGSGPLTETANGGGIALVGGGTIERSSLVGNRVESNGDYAVGGALIQTRAVNNSGTLTITASLISGNQAVSHGDAAQSGALANYNAIVIGHSTLNANSAEGPIVEGGAIYSLPDTTLTVRNSAILLNTARAGVGDATGGAFLNAGTLSIVNSTLSDNSAIGADDRGAQSGGGALYNFGPATTTITTSTIVNNTHPTRGGGILNGGPGFVMLQGSILAENWAPSGADCAQDVRSTGYVLIGATAGCAYTPGTGDIQNVRPQLGPLAPNNGPTPTRALRGGPGVDTLPLPFCPTSDQRGVLRPVGALCDIGAYELSGRLAAPFDLATDGWNFENPIGTPTYERYVEEFGDPTTTRLITETRILGQLNASDVLTLPIAYGSEIQATLPLTITSGLPRPPGLPADAPYRYIPDPIAYLYYEDVVTALYDDEITRTWDNSLKSGLCAGMAASAAHFQGPPAASDELSNYLSDYGVSSVAALPFTGTGGLQPRDLIERLHGRQVSAQVLNYLAGPGTHNDARTLYQELRGAIGPNWWNNAQMIGIVQSSTNCDGAEVGHALLPYDTESISASEERIYVYDPNYPPNGSNYTERFIRVDPRTGTWSYDLAPNLTWSGTIIYSLPVNLFLQKPVLPTAQDSGVIMIEGRHKGSWGTNNVANRKSLLQSFGRHKGSWGELTDPVTGQPLRTGCYASGSGIVFAREIKRSLRFAPLVGPRTANSEVGTLNFPDMLYFADSNDLTFTNVATTTDLLFFAPNTAMGVISGSTGVSTDTIKIDKGFDTVMITTNGATKPLTVYQMHVISQTNALESETRIFAVSNADIKAHDTLEFEVSEAKDKVIVRNYGHDTLKFELGLAVVGGNTIGNLIRPIVIEPNQQLTISPPDWHDLDPGDKLTVTPQPLPPLTRFLLFMPLVAAR